MNIPSIRRNLLRWYARFARDLPWRGETDPFRVWVSEVMLQQTQVGTAAPYYTRFLEQYPDMETLANAAEQDVLKAWEGLGYYSRARNLWRTANLLMAGANGLLPNNVSALKKLPGIGEYSAGAIASIAFGQKEPALDGNGKRVLTRLMAFREPVNNRKNFLLLRQRLMDLLPEKQPGDFNQALMDLGSVLCLPRQPLCAQCPLKAECEANHTGAQLEIPVKVARKPIPHYPVVAAVIRREGKALIDKRRADSLLGGMWEFPGGKVEEGESIEEALIRELREELGIVVRVGKKLNTYEHAYTHFSVSVHAIECQIASGTPRALESDEIVWAPIERLAEYPMGKVDRLISLDLLKVGLL